MSKTLFKRQYILLNPVVFQPNTGEGRVKGITSYIKVYSGILDQNVSMFDNHFLPTSEARYFSCRGERCFETRRQWSSMIKIWPRVFWSFQSRQGEKLQMSLVEVIIYHCLLSSISIIQTLRGLSLRSLMKFLTLGRVLSVWWDPYQTGQFWKGMCF